MRVINTGEGSNCIVEQWYVMVRHLTHESDMAYHEGTCAAVEYAAWMMRTVYVCGMRVQGEEAGRVRLVEWTLYVYRYESDISHNSGWNWVRWKEEYWVSPQEPTSQVPQRAGVSERPVTVSRLGLCSQTNSFVIRNKHSSYMIKWSLNRPSKCAGWAVKDQSSFSP